VKWGEVYPLWLTSHDVERYLVERWDVLIDSDYVRIPSTHENSSGYQQRKSGIHTGYNDLVFESIRMIESASGGLDSIRLKITDLIEGNENKCHPFLQFCAPINSP
jgi:hypothetical protein